AHGTCAKFAPGTAGFYLSRAGDPPLDAARAEKEHHRFLTVEFSCPFLARHLGGLDSLLHPVARAAITNCPCEHVAGAVVRLRAAQYQTVSSLRQPPVYAAAQ